MAATKTLKVEGMMCSHCEKAVKNALEALDGITSATADHEKNTVVITMDGDFDEAAVKAAIEAEDYQYLGQA